ncbi:MAG TPA: rod shape-determining protein MreD [Acidimicrobiia bacterium]|nr:rod shape-determining protein MreD [Acidimicrobiia bacterium]
MRLRLFLVPLACLVAAVILQTTLFSRFSYITPDLVLLVIILLAITDLPREGVLVMAFSGGLVVDMLGSTALGLRAAVFTVIGYAAVKTAQRVDIGPVAIALWVAALTLAGVALFLVVGTLFGQGGLISTGLARRLIFVPLSNLVLSFVVAPLMNRLIRGKVRGLL